MTIRRKWYCTCRGKPVELPIIEASEDDPGEPTCPRCGASVSSDPKRTIIYRDAEDRED